MKFVRTTRPYSRSAFARRSGRGSGVHPRQQDTGHDPAALDRCGETQQLLVLAVDQLVADLPAQQRVGCEAALLLHPPREPTGVLGGGTQSWFADLPDGAGDRVFAVLDRVDEDLAVKPVRDGD